MSYLPISMNRTYVMNPRLKTEACPWRYTRRRIRDDWLHDRQPAGRGYTSTGMVLGRDVTGGVEVGIEMKTAFPTPKRASGTAVVAGDMPAAATGLRSVPWVNHGYRTTSFLGLVRNKALELSERPGVHLALRLCSPSDLHPLTDVFEIFQHDRAAWLGSTNDLFGEHMITVSTKAPLLMAYTSQMASGAFGSLLLQRSLEMKQPCLDRLPAPFAEKLTRRRDRRATQAQIDTDDLSSRLNLWLLNADDDVQPPGSTSLDQVGGIDRIAHILFGVVGYAEADRLSPTDQCQTDRGASPIEVVGALIVAWWAKTRSGHTGRALRVAPQCECTFQRFGGFHSRLNEQVARQIGQRVTQRVVGQAVQPGRVRDIRTPAALDTTIERLGREQSDARQVFSLGRCWLKLDTDRALHMRSIAYNLSFRNTYVLARRSTL